MKGKGGFLRDNVEAFAVAIAMALVIRHFCIEAFRIPPGSMMPTLLGDRMPDTSQYEIGDRVRRMSGERILVDKFAWLRRNPRRFEVAVFQYPLNRSKNFIKRIAGMPGEWLRIVDGDLWTSDDEGNTWRIQRKPAGVGEQLMFAYYPKPVDDPEAFQGVTCWEGGEGWTVDSDANRFDVAAGKEPTALEFLRKVMPYDSVDDGDYAPQPHAGDVRIGFHARVKRGGELAVVLTKHGVAYRLVLGTDGSHFEWGEDAKRETLSCRLGDGPVSFAFVDDTLRADVDGETFAFELPARKTPPSDELFEDKWGHHSIRIEARGCACELTKMRIDRDVHYTSNDTDFIWKIPDEHYFMLGDNTQHSKDSRAWHVAEAHHENGEVIRWEVHPNDGTQNPSGGEALGGDDAELIVQSDINGLTRRFKNREISRWESNRRWPFVSKDHLIGRAFAVFWPVFLPPVSMDPTRVKLIR